jgi:hypothetical protein
VVIGVNPLRNQFSVHDICLLLVGSYTASGCSSAIVGKIPHRSPESSLSGRIDGIRKAIMNQNTHHHQ